MRPERHIEERAARYDPLLRFRFDERAGLWRINRLTRRVRPAGWFMGGALWDVREEEVPVSFWCDTVTHAFRPLDERVFRFLWEADSQRAGGSAAFNRELDDKQDRLIEAETKARRSDIRDIAKYEVWPKVKRELGQFTYLWGDDHPAERGGMFCGTRRTRPRTARPISRHEGNVQPYSFFSWDRAS